MIMRYVSLNTILGEPGKHRDMPYLSAYVHPPIPHCRAKVGKRLTNHVVGKKKPGGPKSPIKEKSKASSNSRAKGRGTRGKKQKTTKKTFPTKRKKQKTSDIFGKK